MNKFARKGGDRMTAVLERARDYAAPLTQFEPQMVPLSSIDVNPDQPRKHFDPAALNDLARSIELQGVLQPILLRPRGQRFEIVFGERRYRASQLAGKTDIPAMVRPVADDDLPVVAALENLQRSDLNRFEEVRAKVNLLASTLGLPVSEVPAHLKRMRSQELAHVEEVLAVEQVFSQLGGEQWKSFVVNGLPVLNLSEPMRTEVESGRLAYSKALLIARAPVHHHQELVTSVIEENLSQVALQQRIKALLSPTVGDDVMSDLKRRLSTRRLSQLSPEQRAEASRLMTALRDLLS